MSSKSLHTSITAIGCLFVYSFYNAAVQTWLRSHYGRVVTEWQIAGIFGEAYSKAATVKNAVSGLKKNVALTHMNQMSSKMKIL